MAVKDSTELGINERYPLGEYSFRVERSAGTSPNYDKIEAICTKDGKNARKSIQVPSSAQLLGWYVEANETEVTVYAIIEGEKDARCTGPTASAGAVYATGNFGSDQRYWTCTRADEPVLAGVVTIDGYRNAILLGTSFSNVSGTAFYFGGTHPLAATTMTIDGVAFALLWGGGVWPQDGAVIGAELGGSYGNESSALRDLVDRYFVFEEGEGETTLVGRFAIDIEDAGGVGPGSDWTDPGDYDPDWEEGDPTHTLYVTVTGALSGRHNDPIVDPSYSYIPSDKNTVKDYGCGGDGGHGGGGGAGASTIVIHKFATNQANSKEVTAIARRHGYGSGGGKGGKGGDGCILVYY